MTREERHKEFLKALDNLINAMDDLLTSSDENVDEDLETWEAVWGDEAEGHYPFRWSYDEAVYEAMAWKDTIRERLRVLENGKG